MTSTKRILPKGDDGPAAGATLDELFEHLKEHVEIENKVFPRNDVVEVFIKTDRPLPIVFSADWHVGSSGTDYTALQADLAFLAAHPEVKLALLGDICDNYGTSFKSSQPVLDQVCSPKMQRQILVRMVEQFSKNDTLVAAVGGNHELRDEHLMGENTFSAILSKAACVFDNQGIVVLLVGRTRATAAKYVLLLAHKPPSRSAGDKLSGAKKLYSTKLAASCICSAHFHDPGITQDTHYNTAREMGLGYGGRRILLSLGTYCTDDIFSKRHWNGGQLGSPTVLFWPGEYRMEVFSSAPDALIYREGMRHWKVTK